MTTGHGPFRSTLLTASKQISIWTGPIPGKSGRQQCFPRAAYCSATTGRFAALLQVRLAAYRGRRHPKRRLPAFGRKPYTNSRSSSTPTAREIYFKPARTMISHILIKGKAFSGFPFIQASPPAIPRSRRTGTGSGARPRNASPFRRSSWRGGSYPSTRNRRHGRGSASSLCA